MSDSPQVSVPGSPTAKSRLLARWTAAAVLAAALVWSYRPTLTGLMRDWRFDDVYSVWPLVPPTALYLLWNDRKMLAGCRLTPCWWGLVPILLALGMRAYGLIFMFESAERYSLVIMIAGLTLLIAGRQVFRKVAWILAFLLLMVPLPGRIHNQIAGPLQGLATSGAVFVLELFGIEVERRGHTMLLHRSFPVNVAEACSGLQMLTAFIVVAAVLAYVVDRPRWHKAVVLASSIPVAIFCNLVRLVVTVLLFLAFGGEFAKEFFHGFVGLAMMMPLAVLILVGEFWILSRLVVED